VTVMPGVLEAPPLPPRADRGRGRTPPPPPTGDDGRGDHDPEPRRRGLDNARLAMLVLMSGEVMFFSGLVSAYLVLRSAAPVWPPPLQPRLPIAVTGANTLVLLASSVCMAAAVRACRQHEARGLRRWLAATAVLGALFLAVQGYEWVRLVRFGVTLSSGVFGGTFYTLIGAHAAHVLGALVWLTVTLVLALRGAFDGARGTPVETCAMYWHFVVALWPLLYLAVYLT
jgi:heme/copper-type cytochrome/quinol oxidase subunit 3